MGNILNEVASKEHDGSNAVKAKRVFPYGWDYDNLVPVRIAVDSNGTIDVKPSTPSSFGHLKVTVPTAGTPVQVSATSVATRKVYLSGDTDNGTVMVVGGDNTVRATANNKNGLVIVPGNNPTEIDIDNLQDLWVDAETNGGILCVSYSA